MITKGQYEVSKQTIQNKHIKINLLNYDYQIIDELSGNAISGTINIDANADIRRTCSITLVVTDSSFEPSLGSKIFLDRYIQLFVGIESLTTDETVWFNQGMYIIDAPSYTYDAVTHTLSFSGLDLMSKLTGLRDGYIPAQSLFVPRGSNVKSVIEAAISDPNLGGFNRYAVEECKLRNGDIQSVPYDITMDVGTTVYDLLAELRNILPYYQIYFDEYGVFHYNQIPTGADEDIVAMDDVFDEILLSETIDTDFASVKNVIEVFGATLDVQYFASETTVTQSEKSADIFLTIPSFYEWIDIDAPLPVDDNGGDIFGDYLYFGFTMPVSISNKSQGIHLSINGKNSKLLYDYRIVGNTLNIVSDLSAGNSYMIVYNKNGDWWKLYDYGEFHAIVKEENPESPFYIGNPAGELYLPLSGGDYENIVGTELCYERALYELYLRARMQDSVALTCVPIFYLDVNQIIGHAIKDHKQQKRYIIKSISIDLSTTGTMVLNVISYYPLWSDVVINEYIETPEERGQEFPLPEDQKDALSVNGVLPDANGNVQLTPQDINENFVEYVKANPDSGTAKNYGTKTLTSYVDRDGNTIQCPQDKPLIIDWQVWDSGRIDIQMRVPVEGVACNNAFIQKIIE